MPRRISYYVAGIVVRRRRTAEGLVTKVLVVDTLRGVNKKVVLVQFPGGMETYVDYSDLGDTLRREVKDETGLIIKPEAKPLHLVTFVVVDKGGNEHHRVFYLIRKGDCLGSLRKARVFDGDTILDPPRWLDIREFGKVCRTHRIVQPFLEEALQGLFAA